MIFRIINGRMFDKSYQLIDVASALKIARKSGLEEFVVKPARDTGGGSRVSFLSFAELATFVPSELKEQSDWIIQRPAGTGTKSWRRCILTRSTPFGSSDHQDGDRLDLRFVSPPFVRIGARTRRVDNLTPGKGIGVEVCKATDACAATAITLTERSD